MENKKGKVALNDDLLDKVSGGWAPAPVLCVDPEACPFEQLPLRCFRQEGRKTERYSYEPTLFPRQFRALPHCLRSLQAASASQTALHQAEQRRVRRKRRKIRAAPAADRSS